MRVQGLLRGCHLQQQQTLLPVGKLTKATLWILVDIVADPLLDAQVLSVQRHSAGDRHNEFRNAVSELVQPPWAGWPSRVRPSNLHVVLQIFLCEHALHPSAHHSLPTDPAAQEYELPCRAIELGLTFDQLQGAELSCFELLARRLQMLEMKLRDKVARSLFGGFNRGGQPHLPWNRADSWAAHDRASTGGVCFRCAGERNSRRKGTSQVTRRTTRRAARRRQEEMTEPCEKGLGVLLTESVQQGNRPVSRELIPLPVPFPENEHVESEHLRSLSRAVRSRVVRRVGWQGWANDGVRSMNEIYSKTSASEAGSRSSSLQLASLSRICSVYQDVSAAECKSAAEAFKALCGSVPGYTDSGVKQATFKEGLVSLTDPCSKMADGADLLIGSDFEAWRDWRSVLLRSPCDASRGARAGREGCS